MDYFLLILSFILLVLGVLGSILPAIPGPPLAWLGLLMLNFTEKFYISPSVIWPALALTIIVTILDFVIPVVGTKHFGGTKYGVWGTNIGLVIGLFLPIPLGFLIGALLGAFIGEIIKEPDNINRAFYAALGAFIGFIGSTIMKVMLCIAFFIIALYCVFT